MRKVTAKHIPEVGSFIVGTCIITGHEVFGYVKDSRISGSPLNHNKPEAFVTLTSNAIGKIIAPFDDIFPAWLYSYRRIPRYAIEGFLALHPIPARSLRAWQR